MISFGRIFSYIWSQARYHKISCFFIFIGYGVGVFFDSIAMPYVYKELIDTLSSGSPKEVILVRVTHLIYVICVFVVLYNIGYRVGDYCNSYFQSKVMKRLYDLTFRNFLQHSYTFFSNNFSGSLVAKAKRLTKAFEVLADVISFQIWFSFIVLAGIITVLYFKVPLLATIFLIWSFIYIGITIFFIRRKIRFDIQEAEADSRVTALLSDAILNIFNIKTFSADTIEQDTFERTTLDEEHKRRRAWYFGNFQNGVQAILMASLRITIIIVSIRLWDQGTISLGMIVFLQIYLFNLFDILWNLGKALTKGMKAITDMKEVVDIFELSPGILDPQSPEMIASGEGLITFDSVTFSYTEGPAILEDFSLSIAPGERVGLVGHSGAGKSTLTRLLIRFTDTQKGIIAINGQDIKYLTQNDLRSLVSYVPQESVLFHRTIRENIAYGKPDATDEEIRAAARAAYASEFIEHLSNGYDTLVGERGVKLSGGERQRIAIARAMIKNAPILILDEATSSLDSVSEKYIQEAFNELMKGKTTIVIAHRLSTIQKMDRIIVLENGRIIQEGTHTQLLAQDGTYANLWNHQVGGFIE